MDARLKPIYLDYSATTPVDKRVAEKMNDYLGSVSLADVVSHQQGKQVQVIKHFRRPDSAQNSNAPEKVAA